MIRPKKSLGQNFLIDQNVINKIINFGDIKNENILEIGPGTGYLTKNILIKKPKKLIVIEKDALLIQELKKNVKHKDVEILNEDILKTNLELIMLKNTIVYGNLPYNISTQILIRLIQLLDNPLKFSKLIIMFQKEVAEKIMAKFNTKNYGRLTVIANWRLKITNHLDISKNCFWPKPKIDSTLLVFEPLLKAKYKINKISSLEYITRVFFSNKRKMINKCFKTIFDNPVEVSKKLNINLSCRPAEISAEKYYEITELFEKYNK